LKPTNIKVRVDGAVKVLDFGLAKAFSSEHDVIGPSSLTNSPTITSPLGVTNVGVLLGTAAYMSPEQARGGLADRRSDIWAFGVVLYEMLVGRALFQGATLSDTLAAVLKTEPDWTALPKDAPVPVRRLLRRCLEKDKRRRLDSAADARLELEEALVPAEKAIPSRAAEEGRSLRRRNAVLLSAAVLAIAAALIAVGWWLPRRPVPTVAPATIRFSAGIGADASLVLPRGGARRGGGSSIAIPPDGRFLAFAAQAGTGPIQLYVRDLEQLDAVALPGTDDAAGPFFSPDGEWVGFFAQGRLKKVQVSGGAVTTLSDAPAARGGTWGDDGTIVYSPRSDPGVGLMRVSSAGGTPTPVTNVREGESTHRWAHFLPGSKAVLYTASRSNTGPYDLANLVLQPLPSGAPSVLVEGGSDGRYVPSGHLAYVRGGTLFAAPFDLERLKLTGDAAPVVEGVTYAIDAGAAQFAISTAGTLAYLPAVSADNQAELSWVSQDGTISKVRDVPNWGSLAFSPDGQRLALANRVSGLGDIWIYDLNRDTSARLTAGPEDDFAPAWSPDGQYITFTSARLGGVRNIFVQRSDGTGQAVPLTSSQRDQQSDSVWHPAGRLLAFSDSQQGVMLLPMKQGTSGAWDQATPTLLMRGSNPRFSPDGKWIAYNSDESGSQEVYVQPFPSLDGKWQVSTTGGQQPRWSSSERALLYVHPTELTIMRVPFDVDGESLRPGRPAAPMGERAGLRADKLGPASGRPSGADAAAPAGSGSEQPRQPRLQRVVRRQSAVGGPDAVTVCAVEGDSPRWSQSGTAPLRAARACACAFPHRRRGSRFAIRSGWLHLLP
jgi:serine/threonine-protein kinase